MICRQGDPADSFYLVRIGFVKVSEEHPGGDLVLAYLSRGNYFGEIGLLGLVSAKEVGGRGESLLAASSVVRELAKHCGSTAMVVLMHYAATLVIEATPPAYYGRVMSLTIRLYANIFAGDMVTLVFFSLIPIGVPVIFLGLHLGVALLQAFIFVLLTTVYLAGAVGEEH